LSEMAPGSTPQIARFGEFTVDFEQCRLLREGQEVSLQPRAFDLLVHLLHHPDKLLSRDDLLDALWPDVFVSDEALNQMVRRLRKALGDSARDPRYLATVSRRGYRFVAAVRWSSEEGYGAGTHSQALVPTTLPEELLDAAEAARAPAPDPAFAALVDEEPTPFFGRAAELEGLLGRAGDGARLITLLGPGGMGKTRLSRRFAAALIGGGGWPGGQVFVDLSEATDLEGVARAASAALGVPLGGSAEDAVEQLGRAFAARGRALLILDNFELVAELADKTVGAWLKAAPEALFLVTSRVRLRLRGEEVVDLGPLDVEAARALFQERARAAGARTAAEPEDVDGLVKDLEGSPLAIELAAGRARVMSAAQIRGHLDRRFQLLRAARRDAPHRHRSLHAVIEDSVERLETYERDALIQLSALAGVFSYETADRLLELPPDAPWALDLLQDLSDQSVLQTRALGEDRQGFLVLESVRQFLAPARTDGAERLRGMLLERLRGLVADAPEDPELTGLIATAVAESERCRDPEWLSAMVLAVFRWLRERGTSATARQLLDRALAAAPPPETQIRLLMATADCDQRGARSWLDKAAALAEAQGLERLSLEIALDKLTNQLIIGDADGVSENAAALLARAEASGDVHLQFEALLAMALMTRLHARYDEVGLYLRRAQALSLGGTGEQRARLEDLLGLNLSERGDFTGAVAHYHRALALYGELGWRRRQGAVLSNLSSPLSFSGRFAEAVAALEEGLAIFKGFGDVMGQAVIETNLSLNYLLSGRLDDARRAIASGQALMEQAGFITGLVTLYLNAASLLWIEGELEGALEECAVGLDMAEAHGLVARAVMLRGWRAGILAELGDLEGAEAALAAAHAELLEGSQGRTQAAMEVIDCMVEVCRLRREGALAPLELEAEVAALRASREPTVKLLMPLLERAMRG
jgi:DNA-binding winged helix-turn-helix (wHTH) protein/predicted ATPase